SKEREMFPTAERLGTWTSATNRMRDSILATSKWLSAPSATSTRGAAPARRRMRRAMVMALTCPRSAASGCPAVLSPAGRELLAFRDLFLDHVQVGIELLDALEHRAELRDFDDLQDLEHLGLRVHQHALAAPAAHHLPGSEHRAQPCAGDVLELGQVEHHDHDDRRAEDGLQPFVERFDALVVEAAREDQRLRLGAGFFDSDLQRHRATSLTNSRRRRSIATFSTLSPRASQIQFCTGGA